MNELQEAVLDVIVAIFSIEDIHNNFDKDGPWKGQQKIRHATIRYGLLNYVAKFSLANDRYFVTEKRNDLVDNNFLKNGVLQEVTTENMAALPMSILFRQTLLPIVSIGIEATR